MIIKSNGMTMNWEVAGVWLTTLSNLLENAKQQFPHDCTASIKSCEKNDGGPYGSLNNATFYYLQVQGPDETDARFIKGIADVLKEITHA